MDNVFKGIVTAGVINLVTGSLVIGLSIGWLVYLYESKKDDQKL